MESSQSLVEEAVVFGTGRVKQGLIWLSSEEASKLGLSLEQLTASVVHNRADSEDFYLGDSGTCALGYAGDWTSYAHVRTQKGNDWLVDHGFLLSSKGFVDFPADSDFIEYALHSRAAYAVLTEEWRTQLKALASERGRE